MTIFDTIRYPITEDFRMEDLQRIPFEIYSTWWYDDLYNIRIIKEEIHRGVYSPTPAEIYFLVKRYQSDTRIHLVKLLRQRILEYEQ